MGVRAVVRLGNRKPAEAELFVKLRGRDSNPDYLIQSPPKTQDG